MAGLRAWLCGLKGGHGRGLLVVRALEPGRLAPAACGEQKPTQLMLYGKTGPPPHVRGAVGVLHALDHAGGSTPARAGSSLPDLHLHLGKSPFHANFAMSATLASPARVPPPLPGFPRRALHAWSSQPAAGRSTEPRRYGRSLHPLGAGNGPGRSQPDPSPYR